MRTYHKRAATRFGVAVLSAAALTFTGTAWATDAHAMPGVSGCQLDSGLWLFHGTRRSLCDTPVRADGSWSRAREFWTPAHYVPVSTYCSGSYFISCTTSGGYEVDRASNGIETYVVTPDTVLPDEPGHLDNGVVL